LLPNAPLAETSLAWIFTPILSTEWTIGKNGRVGIGTTNPVAKLDVNGEYMVVEGLGGVQAYIGDDGTATTFR